VKALSENQFRAATEGGVPADELVLRRDDGTELWSVAVPMPSEALAYTLSTVVKPGPASTAGLTVVDPGWSTREARAKLDASLAALGHAVTDLAFIVVTHAHPDHLGLASELAEESGAKIIMHEREQQAIDHAHRAEGRGAGVDMVALAQAWGVPAEVADRLALARGLTRGGGTMPDHADILLADGDPLPIPGLNWHALWTPGHTAGHLCIVAPDERIFFSGDHVLPTVFPGIGIGVDWGIAEDLGNPVASALDSLDRLAPYDEYQVIPGHGYRFTGLADRRAEAADHILTRAREVAASEAETPEATVWELASRLTWSAGWAELAASPAVPSALLQTAMYRDFVRGGWLRERDTAHAG